MTHATVQVAVVGGHPTWLRSLNCLLSECPLAGCPLQGGKAAAETILDMRVAGDFSRASCRAYETRWMKYYGFDFNNVSLRPPWEPIDSNVEIIQRGRR